MQIKPTLIALASTALLATGAVHAADTKAPVVNRTDGVARTMPVTGDRDALENKLRAGKTRADYAKILKANGYVISHINEDKKDYLEYEVVKGRSSYEVKIDFKDGAARATDVDVSHNMWRAEATERLMEDPNYKQATTVKVNPDGRYSDSRYIKGWTDEKDRLEKALPLNLKGADYKAKIEAEGYKVTAVNERDRSGIEYEIVKGDNSYEVDIELDPATGLAKDIDVSSNLWEAEATDRATDRAKAMKK